MCGPNDSMVEIFQGQPLQWLTRPDLARVSSAVGKVDETREANRRIDDKANPKAEVHARKNDRRKNYF